MRIDGIGKPVSTAAANDTINSFMSDLVAHDAYFMSPDGTLLFDEPGMRGGTADALGDYTRPAKRDCSPPGAASWGDADNNVNFLNQIVLMTPNASLSIPGSQRSTNPNNYYHNIATIEWPDALDGRALTFLSQSPDVLVFASRSNPEGAKDFLRHLMQPGPPAPTSKPPKGAGIRLCQSLPKPSSGSIPPTRTAPFWRVRWRRIEPSLNRTLSIGDTSKRSRRECGKGRSGAS